MATTIDTTPELLRDIYARMEKNLAVAGKRLGRPLTFAEKINQLKFVTLGLSASSQFEGMAFKQDLHTN